MRRLRSGRGVGAVGAIAIVGILALAVALRGALAAALIPAIAGSATGTTIQFSRIDLHRSHATFAGVIVTSRGGQQIAYIPRMDLSYDLHDLLPGSMHRFGLRAIALYDPQISIVHNRDGSYNIPAVARRAASPHAAAPLAFFARVIDGRVTFTDYTRVDPTARYLHVDGVNLNAVVNTAGSSRYTASLAYREGSHRYPIAGSGTIDAASGATLQRWTAARIPLPRLLNYAVNNPGLHALGGTLDGIDVFYYGKLAARASVNNLKLGLAQLREPIRDGNGTLDAGSDTVTTNRFKATLNGIRVRVSGGVSDLHDPRLRFAISGSGDAAQFARALPQTARLPVRGPVAFDVLAEGTPKRPLVFVSARSSGLEYGAERLERPRVLVALNGADADVIGARVGYHSMTLTARGRLSLKSQPNALEMVGSVRAPSRDVPFAPTVLAPMELSGSILAVGNDFKHFGTRGILTGEGSAERLAASFDINSEGVGDVAPLSIDAPNRSLFARLAVDRPHGSLTALLHARGFGAAFAGSIDGDVFAERRAKTLGVIGSLDARDVRYGALVERRVRAQFGDGAGDTRIASLDAHGALGNLHAAGTIAGLDRVAIEGTYSGSLPELSRFYGGMPASGRIDAPMALIYDGGRAVVQIKKARFSGASVRGIPIESVSATLETRGKNVRFYAANARVAEGSANAVGTIGRGIALTAQGIDLASMKGAGLPLSSGYVDAATTVRGSLSAPQLDGSLLIDRARFQRYPIDAQAGIAYAGGTLLLRDGLVGVGPALVSVDGSAAGIRPGKPMQPRYDLRASTRAADLHALLAVAQPALAKQAIDGTIDAAVHVGGAGSSPVVRGNVSVPEGAIHGLAFRDLRAQLDGTPQQFAIDGGHLRVGSTAIAFEGARSSGGGLRASIDAPNANLADFNDYFDTGDTLAGNGRLRLAVAESDGAYASRGNLALNGVRYRRFDVGAASANWTTQGRTLGVDARIGGSSGRARIAGTVRIPAAANLTELAAGADTKVHAEVANLDLGTWLPMFGYFAPVIGKLDATAAVRGHFPDESISARAAVNGGRVGRIPIQRAQVALIARHGRGRLTQAVVQIPFLRAEASGTFGLHADDPLDLTLNAVSSDVGSLAAAATGKRPQFAGALDTAMRITGTRNDPRAAGTISLAQLRYRSFTIPHASAGIAAARSQIDVRNGVVKLPHGQIALSASLPIATAPHLGIDSANRPVRAAITAQGVDLRDLDSILPEGTRVAGSLSGTTIVSGTLDNPRLRGGLALQNGSFVGLLDQNPIAEITGAITFSGNNSAVASLHAKPGGGTLSILARARFPNVRDPRAATYAATITAGGAQFNSPQYFRGKVDANLTLSRARGALPALAGTIAIPSARIPLAAFWNPRAPQGPKRALPAIALNVTASAGNDVRVQSSNVDVGATGSVSVGGNLQAPQLDGSFVSTGGTVSFFRTFTIQSAGVRFDRSNGIMPYVNATATTSLSSPQTDVALNVNGLAPNDMKIAFQSDPEYSEQQIMALLAGVGENSGPALAGAGNFSANAAVANLANSQINDFFTRQMLEPLSAQLGTALGLQNLQLTDDFHSGFGVSAAKAFGKHVTAVFNENLGQPQRRTLGIEAHKGEATAFELLLYSTDSPTLLGFVQSSNLLGAGSGIGSPLSEPDLGQSGASLLYEHKF